LVDDGSTDDSLEIIKKYMNDLNIRLYRLRHVGLTSARAFGVSKANGDILVTLDADEILEKDALRRITYHFRDLSVGAVGGSVRLLGEKWFNRANEIIAQWSFSIRKRTPEYGYVFGGCAAYRRQSLHSIGGLATGNIGEDVDASWKIMKHGWRIVLDDKIVAWHKEPKSFKTYTKQTLNAGTRNASTYSVHKPQMLIAVRHFIHYLPDIFRAQGSTRDKILACFLLVFYAILLAVRLAL
jgi:cellulose synthase/poly-beta-1,6-N-acetylglucosamine synthase-like glycosyltransferase